ncbi:MAG: hypothetical protein Phog2KO_31540 [Phototrophicaceae bacterium]
MDKSEAGKKGYQKTKHLLEAHVRRQKQTALEKYENNPKYCPNCDKKLPYKKRHNKFCNQSCSASYNNRGVLRVKSDNPKHCAHCGNVKETRKNKYCDTCIEDNVYSNKVFDTTVAKQDSTRRRILLEKRDYKCESCGLVEWLGQDIPLELDHIDGDSDNNLESNLRLICPNCHALTDTYKGANSGNSARQKMRRHRYKQGKTY